MNILITGGAGFIGSNLTAALLQDGRLGNQPISKIVIADNLSLGRKEFIQQFIDGGKVEFYEQDLLDIGGLKKIFQKHKFDAVFHLAANSDIGYGTKFTDWDLKQGTLATYNVLEAMRRTGCKKIVFASSSAIYGEAVVKPTPEDCGPLLPISFYGASKLACEGLITAFCHNFGFKTWLFRFGNIVGKNGTHGAMVDFIYKLKVNPSRLEVLGNGRQAKPYLYVQDCVDGMIYGFNNASEQVNYFNLACRGASSVKHIARTIIGKMGLKQTAVRYTGGERGWKGDVPQVRLDPRKLSCLGWTASYTSDQAVQKAAGDLITQLL
jgi:UDP-glucose 4-epimerase